MTCGHSLSRRRRPDRAALYPTLATLDGLPALTDSIVGDDLQRDGFSESSEVCLTFFAYYLNAVGKYSRKRLLTDAVLNSRNSHRLPCHQIFSKGPSRWQRCFSSSSVIHIGRTMQPILR
jgi:hypothetical protein